MKTANSRIIWAVDPFEKTDRPMRSAAWAIRALTKNNPSAQVMPVYLWGPASSTSYRAVRDHAEGRLGSVLSRVKLPNVQELWIPQSPSTGITEGVHNLILLAQELNADLIVTSTHGRSGLKRWTLGSFTETLVLHSPVPVLTVHPKWGRTPDLKLIIFPTDFSAESAAAFERAVELARAHGSRMMLLHKITLPFIPSYDLAFAAAQVSAQEFTDEIRVRKAEGEKWAAYARKQGVHVDVVIDRSRTGSVADAVLKRCKALQCLIALAGESRPITAAILGSASRQIIRRSEQPVWILHPTTKANFRKRAA